MDVVRESNWGSVCGVLEWASDGCRVGESGCVDCCNATSETVRSGGDMCGVVGGTSGNNFGGFANGSWANGKGVGVYAVSKSVGDVFSSNYLSIGSYPTV